VCAALVAVVWAWYLDSGNALWGAVLGLLVGAVGGPIAMTVIHLIQLVETWRRPRT
jgi:hypothetical protein